VLHDIENIAIAHGFVLLSCIQAEVSGGFRDLGGGGGGRLPFPNRGAVQGWIAPPEQIWVDF